MEPTYLHVRNLINTMLKIEKKLESIDSRMSNIDYDLHKLKKK